MRLKKFIPNPRGRVSRFALTRNSRFAPLSAVKGTSRVYNTEVESYSYIGRFCLIQYTTIGRFCSISDYCNIGLLGHSTNWASLSPVFQGRNATSAILGDLPPIPVRNTSIGHDVWIGLGSLIMGGVSIGTGSVVGAGAVVTKDVPPYTIVAGNPAKPVRPRFEATTAQALLESKWWHLPEDELRRISPHVADPQQFLAKIASLRSSL